MNVRIIDPNRRFLQSARPWRRGSAIDDFADLDGDGAEATASDDPRQPDSDPMESPAAGGEEGTCPTG